MEEKVLCCCHNVTEKDVKKHIENGVKEFSKLQELTGIGTDCPPCTVSSEEAFNELLKSKNEG